MRDRSAFLYYEPNPDTPDHAQCATCWKFLRGIGKCDEMDEKYSTDDDDTCGAYGQGEPNDDPKARPRGKYTPKDVGWLDGKVQCHRCNAYDDRDKTRIHCDLYVQLNRIFPRLFKLIEVVRPRACCNAWGPGKRDPKNFGPYGPMPDADDPNSGGILSRLLKAIGKR